MATRRRRRRPRPLSPNERKASFYGSVVGLIVFCAVGSWVLSLLGILPAVSVPSFSAESGKRKKPAAGAEVGKKILAKAKEYDKDFYVLGGGHPPSEYDFGEGLDCSGIIDVAVLKVTGINNNLTAREFRKSPHWKKVSFKDARPGDILYILKEKHPGRTQDHVVIVEKNGGDGKLTVFAARTPGGPKKDQIKSSSGQSYSIYDGALRFVG